MQLFGFDAGLTDDGHKAGITGPARKHVQMKMANDAGAGGTAKIHAQVESLGAVRVLKRYLNALRQGHHFGEHSWIGARQVGRVRVRNDHDVTAGIGVTIQNDEVFFSTEGYERLWIIVGFESTAENTAIVLGGVSDIAIPPGRPDVIHPGEPRRRGPSRKPRLPPRDY